MKKIKIYAFISMLLLLAPTLYASTCMSIDLFLGDYELCEEVTEQGEKGEQRGSKGENVSDGEEELTAFYIFHWRLLSFTNNNQYFVCLTNFTHKSNDVPTPPPKIA